MNDIEYDIEELIDIILIDCKYISYYFNDYNYMIEYNYFYGDIYEKRRFDRLLTFKNVVIHFEKEFNNYNITKYILEKLNQIQNKYIDDIDIFNIIKIIEKKKNEDYVLIYSYKPFYNDNDNNDYYSNIIELLLNICNINNYKYKLDKSKMNIDYPDYQYKFLNEDYIIENYDDDIFNIKDFIKNDDNYYSFNYDINYYKCIEDYNETIEYYNKKNNYENLLIYAASEINSIDDVDKMNVIYFKTNIICFKNEKYKKGFINYLNKYKENNNLSLLDFRIKFLSYKIFM